MQEINTVKELYDYCMTNHAEDYRIVIEERRNVDKAVGLWLVTERKEGLIVIPNQR